MAKNPKILKSKPQNVQRAIGNQLSVFVGPDDLLYILDQLGNVDLLSNYIESNPPSGSSLGKLKLSDFNGTVFTDLTTATEYVQQFTTATLTETSFDNGIFYFSVPENTLFNQAQGFCGKITNGEQLEFVDVFGYVTFFESSCFEDNAEQNVFGNILGNFIANTVSFKDNCFYKSSGNNLFGNNFTFVGDECFATSTGNNSLKNTILFEGVNCFNEALGRNSFENDITFNEVAFEAADGFNVFYGGVNFLDYAFNNYTGNTIFYKSITTVDNFLSGATGTHIFYGQTQFGSGCFNVFVGGTNIFYGPTNLGPSSFQGCENTVNFFYGITSLDDNCFEFGNSLNYFYKNVTASTLCFNTNSGYNVFYQTPSANFFDASCFNASIGTNIFYGTTTFGNACFNDATSNNSFYGELSVGDSFMQNASPTDKNVFQNFKTATLGPLNNVTGRFDFTGKLGTNATATLPSTIFRTANLCSIHYPNALEYNNAGGQDGDLVNILANATNVNNKITID